MASYDDSPSWHRYRDILQDSFNLTLTHQPIETWSTVRGHEVHIDTGPDGPIKGTAILVHGGGGHGRILAPLGDLAASLGWRALAPDLPGYGLTKPANNFHWNYAEWPAVIAELADSSNGPVVLIGLSVGGSLALAWRGFTAWFSPFTLAYRSDCAASATGGPHEQDEQR